MGAGGDIRYAGGDGFAPCYSYSHSKGLYAGITIDGTVVMVRNNENARFYGQNVTPADILDSSVQPPSDCDPLNEFYRVLAKLDNKLGSQNVVKSELEASGHHSISSKNNGLDSIPDKEVKIEAPNVKNNGLYSIPDEVKIEAPNVKNNGLDLIPDGEVKIEAPNVESNGIDPILDEEVTIEVPNVESNRI